MNDSILIRPARDGDRDFVAGLVPSLLEFGSPAWDDLETLAPGFRDLLAAAVGRRDPRAAVLIAQTADGTPLGFVSLDVREDVAGTPRAHVADLAVTEGARRMGVGRALMQAGETWARQRGMSVLSLDVWSSNEPALAFYRHLGYRAESLCLIKALDRAVAEGSPAGPDSSSSRMADVVRGQDVAVREIREADAENFLRLQQSLDSETAMMMLEPGERRSTGDSVRLHLREALASPNSTIIVAECDARIVGYVEARGGRYRRTRHCAYVVVGVLRSYQGRGIGRSLLAALRIWAANHDIGRLELTVRADNEPARRLYAQAGFTIEGVRRGSLRVGGELVDELAMGLLLDAQPAIAPASRDVRVRPLRVDERPWLEQQLIRLWGSTRVISRGRVHGVSTLAGLVCQAADDLVGVATLDIRDRQCELVTLDAFDKGQGIGSALLAAVVKEARRRGCDRLWLITSNDNLRALRFYQRRGLRLKALHPGAVDEARRIKPEIATVGEHGIPIHDELELELLLN